MQSIISFFPEIKSLNLYTWSILPIAFLSFFISRITLANKYIINGEINFEKMKNTLKQGKIWC